MLDPQRGCFDPIDEETVKKLTEAYDPAAERIFTVGEVVEIKGWKFRVEKIRYFQLVLRPVRPDELYDAQAAQGASSLDAAVEHATERLERATGKKEG